MTFLHELSLQPAPVVLAPKTRMGRRQQQEGKEGTDLASGAASPAQTLGSRPCLCRSGWLLDVAERVVEESESDTEVRVHAGGDCILGLQIGPKNLRPSSPSHPR
jgi:hypothetical protein